MYFGSVRFFRHLIITGFCLLLLLPVLLTGILCVQYTQTRSQMDEAVAAIQECAGKQELLRTDFEKLSNSVRSQIALLQPQINVAISSQMSDFRDQLDGIVSDQQMILNRYGS